MDRPSQPVTDKGLQERKRIPTGHSQDVASNRSLLTSGVEPKPFLTITEKETQEAMQGSGKS